MGINADQTRFVATLKAYPAVADCDAPETIIMLREQLLVTDAGTNVLNMGTVPAGKVWVNCGWGGLCTTANPTALTVQIKHNATTYPQKSWWYDIAGFCYMMNDRVLINEGDTVQVNFALCSVGDFLIGYFTGYQINKY